LDSYQLSSYRGICIYFFLVKTRSKKIEKIKNFKVVEGDEGYDEINYSIVKVGAL
jgi:hypothetical protein